MTDQWDGWPSDGLPDDGLSDGDRGDVHGPADGSPDDDTLPGAGFDDPAMDEPPVDDPAVDGPGPLFDDEPDAAGRDVPDPEASGHGVLGYGDEPLDGPPETDGGTAGFGPAEEGGSDRGGFGHGGPAGGDVPVGADPDADPYAGATDGFGPVFPEPVDVAGLPEPVDGYPWADADLLGAGDVPVLADPAAAVTATPPPADLYAYAGLDVPAGGPGWAGLLSSPDPATSALARFWGAQD